MASNLLDDLDAIVDEQAGDETPETKWELFNIGDLEPGLPIYFDIETGPEDENLLREFFDFDESTVKGFEMLGKPFDESTVKYGMTKDKAKRAAKLADVREKYEASQRAIVEDVAEAKTKAWNKHVEGAPLDATIGRVLAIGYGQGDSIVIGTIAERPGWCINEKGLLGIFWDVYEFATAKRCKLVGFNIAGFDIPFIIRRSWKHHVEVPRGLFVRGRYLADTFVDLLDVWRAGDYRHWCKLDRIARHLGIEGKTGSGGDFHKLFHGTEEERAAAIEYLKNDIRITREVAKRLMGWA